MAPRQFAAWAARSGCLPTCSRKIVSAFSWLLLFNGGRLTFNQRLGLAHERMGNDPVSPTITEVATVELRQPILRNFNSFGERSAGLVRLLGSVVRHRQHHVGFHVAFEISAL